MKVKDAFARWSKTIQALQGVQKLVIPIAVRAETPKAEAYAREFRSLPEMLLPFLKEYVKDEMLSPGGFLYEQFHARARQGEHYYPRFSRIGTGEDTPYSSSLVKFDLEAMSNFGDVTDLSGNKAGFGSDDFDVDDEDDRYEKDEDEGNFATLEREKLFDDPELGNRRGKADTSGKFNKGTKEEKVVMGQGFAALWQAIAADPVFTVEGSFVVAKIGRGSTIMNLRLSDYMKLTGSMNKLDKTLNSLFLAVEYGTGVEENVGKNPAHVRRSGRSKHTDGSGKWWLESRYGKSLFIGQRGFHFLHDARTRAPSIEYADNVRDNLPAFLTDRLIRRGFTAN